MIPAQTPAAGKPIAEITARASEHLAEYLGRADHRIEVVEARTVTWPDGALGCPQPGHQYTQALVSGYYVHLRVGQRDFYYHAGSDGSVRQCPAERSQRPPPETGPAVR